MRYTTFVSFPRSGSHLACDLLLKYFANGDDVPATESHTHGEQTMPVSDIHGRTRGDIPPQIVAGPIRYCHYYMHCHSHPCTYTNTNFQKMHGGEPLFADRMIQGRIIWMLRDPLSCAESWFRYTRRFVDSSGQRFDDQGRPAPMSQEAWNDQRDTTIFDWSNWYAAWRRQIDWKCKTESPSSVFAFRFEDLVASPVEQMERLIRWLVDEPVDCARLAGIIEEHGVINRTRQNFEYQW